MDRPDYEIMARMASQRYQEKYIDKGTADRYALPEEILDDLLGMLKRLILGSADPLKERLLNLYVYCMHETDRMPKEGYNSEQWRNIRTAVSNFIAHLTDFNISVWESREV
jgi:hypothetical protein